MRARSVLLAFAPLLLAGCMTVGRPFSAGQVPLIEDGQTTKEDLRRMFGEPYRQGIDDGDPTWTYVHYQYHVIGDQTTRDLTVRFKPDGTVKSYTFNSNFPEDRAQ